MTRPHIEPAARAYIEAIWAYIADESLAAADRWLSAIAMIGENPGIGHARPEVDGRPLRFLTPKHAAPRTTIVYRDDLSPCRVLRVAGRGRDLSTMLGG